MVSIYILLVSIENKNDNKRSLLLSGFLIGLAFFSKNSIILAVILPLCIIAESGLDSRAKAMKLKYIYSGFSFCLFLGLIMMALLSEISNYTNVVSNVVNNNRHLPLSGSESVFEVILNDSMKAETPRKFSEYYAESGDKQSVGSLFNLYVEEFWGITGIAALIFSAILISILMCGLTSSNLLKILIIVIVSAALFYNNYVDIHDFPKCRQIFSNFILALISVILTINFFKKNYDDRKLNLLALTGFILMLAAFVGSNIGVLTSLRSGGAILLLLSCIIINENTSENGFFRIRISSFKISGFNLIIAFVILLSVWNVNFLDTHRDFPKSSLTSMFKSDILFGVFSNPQRVKAVDELIEFMEGSTFQNNTAVVVGHMPMLHFLLKKDLVSRTPWIEISNFRNFSNKMELLDCNDLPSAVIISEKSGRSQYWPMMDIYDNYSRYDLKWKDYFEYFVRKNNYILGFENDVFRVYHK